MPIVTISIAYILKQVDTYESIASSIIVCNALGFIIYSISFRLLLFASDLDLDEGSFLSLRRDVIITILPLVITYSIITEKSVFPFFVIPMLTSTDVYVQFGNLRKVLTFQFIFLFIIVTAIITNSYWPIYLLSLVLFISIFYRSLSQPYFKVTKRIITSSKARLVSFEYLINQFCTQGELFLFSYLTSATYLSDWLFFKKVIKLPTSYFLSKQLYFTRYENNSVSKEIVFFVLIYAFIIWLLLGGNSIVLLMYIVFPVLIIYNAVVSYPYFLRETDKNIFLVKMAYIALLLVAFLVGQMNPILMLLPLAHELMMASYILIKINQRNAVHNDPP